MSPPLAAAADPASSGPPSPSFAIPQELEAALSFARAIAGPERLGLILGGSHAAGDAVWVRMNDRLVALSDVDLYAVLPDPRACRDAARRLADASAPRVEAGCAGTVEIGFHTPGDLEHLPARPATLELRRHGRVIDGTDALRDRVPAWQPRDVSAEEIALLVENRAYELLWGALAAGSATPLERLAARHAVLKTALDLAGARCLEAGEYPDGAAARVARARSLGRGGGAEPPWDEALAFRHAPAPAADADAEWLAVAAAWETAWRRLVAGAAGGWAAARRAAARAPWRRRVRQALTFRPRAPRAVAPGALRRLTRVAGGTPVHRLNASAAVLTMLRRRALASGGEAPAADRAAAREEIARLGVLDPSLAPDDAAWMVLRLWDAWVLDGRRFGVRS